jgi:signal transduction histidine kinase
MMTHGHSSISRKLMLVTTVISGAALALAGVAFGAYDRASFREETVRNLSIQAQIIASNSASALIFDDPHAVEVTLGAFSASPNIVSAAIFTADGRLFATYGHENDPDAAIPPTIPAGTLEVHRFDDQHLILARRIVFQGKNTGTVSIGSDMKALDTRRNQYVSIIGAVLIVSLGAAVLMAWMSHGGISKPIEQLAQVARRVSNDKDYAVRAPVLGNAYEIIVLTEAFNEMLTEIQRRDQSLHEAHDALEGRVRQRTAELDAANKELEAFSYSVSHDLRAPLRHVAGFAGLLTEHASASLDAKAHKYLHTITTAATRMGRLIDDLLAFSRIGRDQLTRGRVSLNAVVREACHEVTMQVAADNRAIDWHIDDLPDVEGDPAMLRLVMVNLLSNAVKYTAPQAQPRIDVGSDRSGKSETTVFVRDNGVGFDMQYVHKLFGVFQRLHGADEFEGTGIGLANVKRIIHRHGGRVWAEGDVDRGATFFFSLPTWGHHA